MNRDEKAEDSKKRPRDEAHSTDRDTQTTRQQQQLQLRFTRASNQQSTDSSSNNNSGGLDSRHQTQTQHVRLDPSFQDQWLANAIHQQHQQPQSVSTHQVSSSSAFDQTHHNPAPQVHQLLESIQALLANQRSNHGTTFQNTFPTAPTIPMSLQQPSQYQQQNSSYVAQALQALLGPGQGQYQQHSSWQPNLGRPTFEEPSNLQSLLAVLNSRQTASAQATSLPPSSDVPTAPLLGTVRRQFATNQFGDSTTPTNFVPIPTPLTHPPPASSADGNFLLMNLMTLLANQRQQQEQQEQQRQQQQKDQNMLYRQLAMTAAVAGQPPPPQQPLTLSPLQLQLLAMALNSTNQQQPPTPQPEQQQLQQPLSFASLPSQSPPLNSISIPNRSDNNNTSEPIVKDLSQPNDKIMLSRYQVCIRHQLELFTANELDAHTIVQGRKRAVRVNQVGLRCRHCYQLPLSVRARGAVYYPKQIAGIYQAALNMASSHLLDACESVPPNIRDEIRNLRDRHETRIGGKSYWNECCASQGLVERDEALWFW